MGADHAIERMQALAQHVAPAATFPPRTDVDLSRSELRRGEELIEDGAPGVANGVLLHLSSQEDVRSWRLDRWEELARALVDAGRAVLLLSGPAEAEEGRELERRLPRAPGLAHIVARTGLRELASLFTAAGRRGWKMVTCDSGPMHLAWASGLAVVLLEGPQDAARTGPWPLFDDGPHAIVRAASPPSCAPCLRRRCSHADGPVCMSRIDAGAVLAVLD